MVEIICILCKSNKKNSYDIIDIGKDIVIVKSKLIAPTIEYNKGFKPTDPKELFSPMNEFGINPLDKDLAINWNSIGIKLSEKDLNSKSFSEAMMQGDQS
jgi:hypothetical protein